MIRSHISLLLDFILLASSFGSSQFFVNALANNASMMIRPRTFMITGATDGIGKHTAQRLASDKHALLIHGRKSRSSKIVSAIIEDLKNKGAVNVAYLQADFNDLSQVSSFADKAVDILRDWQNVKQKSVPALDVLINNAGVFDPQPRCSVQGYDSTIAVNVLAPFVLTRKLLPVLVGGHEARIITTSSISQSCQLPNLDSLFSRKGGEGGSEYDFKPLPYSAHSSYSHSKLGDLMITVQLARLLSSYELPSNVYSDMDETQRKLLNNMRSIQCLTMDPGTVNTKMLLAGWGPCGIEVKSANNTYKLATSEDYGFGRVENGSYHFGGSGSRDARDAEKLDAFFDKLSKCTGYYYKDLSDCFLLT